MIKMVEKSAKCTQNEHSLCKGDIIEMAGGSKITKICQCQCHDSMYQLVRRIHTANSS
jgi:hypothetical protein